MKKRFISLISLLILNIPIQRIYANKLTQEKEKPNNSEYISLVSEKKQSEVISQNKLKYFLEYLSENIELDNLKEEKTNDFFEVISNNKTITDDLFVAEGDVFVYNNNLVINSDKLQFNSKTKILILEGNIYFKGEGQFLIASKIKYDLKNKKGFILDSYGSINFENIGLIQSREKSKKDIKLNIIKDKQIKNVKLNQSSTVGFDNINFLKGEENFFKKITSQKLNLDLNEMQKWRFQAKKILINDNIWSSEELFLTNDPFNMPQVIINNSGFKSISKNGQITIKSKWSSVNLDNIITIPAGPRRIIVGEDNEGTLGIGYDKNQKDGLFINRKLEPISIFKKAKFKLKPEFYIQRALTSKTNSFSKKEDSVIDPKIEQKTNFLDLFGLEALVTSKLFGFEFNSSIGLNSLDLEKLNKTIKRYSELSKIIYEYEKNNFQKQTKLTFFESYRDKVWNGSLGERDILNGYGMKIENQNNWIKNKVNKASSIAGSYGNFKATKRKDDSSIIERKRLNISLERNSRYPIWEPKRLNKIDREYIYTPTIIPKGLNINTFSKIDLYRYDDGNYQNLFSLKIGPELIVGNFKKKYFDYTKLSIYPKTTISRGKSPFSFDQSVDNHLIEINLKQQLMGPLAIEYKTAYNLDVNSEKFHQFFNTIYELSWNKRAFNLAAYYNSETKTGGFNFKIHNFNFDGLGEKFK